MSPAVNPPGSEAVVEIAEELVKQYTEQGWTLVGVEPERKYLSQQNKAELIETATHLGIDVDDSLTRKNLIELIEGVQAEQK